MPRTIDELLDGLAEVWADLDVTAGEAERLGTAPPALVDTMRALREPLVKVPIEVGGDQLSMADQLRYFEALSHANPTAGWIGFNHAGGAAMAASRLPDAGVEAVFGGDAVPFVAAVAAPTGFFEVVEGGIRLTGTYRYASGVGHADWVFLTAVERADEPCVRVALAAAADVEVCGEWNVMALKGTGSLDVVVDDVFVPDHLMIDPLEAPRRGGPLYSVSYPTFVAAENLGFTLGVCQRFLDELITYAKGKSRGPDGRLADRGAFQHALAKGQMQIDAARALGADVLGNADAVCGAEGGLTDDHEQRIAAMVTYGTASAVDAVTTLYGHCGAGALFDHNVLQRCLRDALGSAQHAVASSANLDRLGQAMLRE